MAIMRTLGPLVGLAATLAGCTPAQSGAAVATAVCILTTVSADVSAGDPWQQCVADAVAKCGADAGTVATVWAAHEHAMVVDGVTPPTIRGRQ